MSDRMGGKKPRPNGRVFLGLMLIGTGRPAGFAQFGGSGEAYLASLAPWLGLLIVITATLAVSGRAGLALAFFLVALCNLLAPAVIGEALCRLWDRRQHWALYANILNCAQWLMLAVIVLLLPLATIAASLGVSQENTARLLLTLIVTYVMWFQWFVARHALQLTRLRALVVMLCVLFGTAMIVHLPAALTGNSSPDAFSALTAPAGTRP